MADETRTDNKPIDNPGDNPGTNPVDNPQQPTPESDQQSAPKPHTIPKSKKEAPAWLQAIGGFFKAIFVTPWALMQKVFLRIAGGKKMVEATEQKLLEELKEQEVHKAETKQAAFLEREINDLLKERMQDPAYTTEGLAITKVAIEPNVTGEDGVKYSITVTCTNDGKDGGEYQLHMSQDGRLLYNAIVPEELQLQLQELIKSASLTSGEPEVGYYEEPFEENIDQDANGLVISVGPPQHLPKDTPDSNDEQLIAAVTITGPDVDGTTYNCTATFERGHIRVDNLPTNLATNPIVAQTIYQAFKPILEQNLRDSVRDTGNPIEQIQAKAIQDGFINTLHSIDTAASADPQKSTSMFLIPSADGHTTVINQNIQPGKPNGNVSHLHAFHLDTNNPQCVEFDAIPNAEPRRTQFANQSFGPTQPEKPRLASLAQFYYVATNQQCFPIQHDEAGRVTEQFIVVGDRDQAARADKLSEIACAHVIQRHEGFELRTETHLSNTDLQKFAHILSSNDAPATFTAATRSAAATTLNQAAHYAQSDKQFTRYFVMGDTVMSYDGTTFTMQRPNDKAPFEYAAEKLDADTIETAYSQYSQSRGEHAQPNVDETQIDIDTPPSTDEVEETI